MSTLVSPTIDDAARISVSDDTETLQIRRENAELRAENARLKARLNDPVVGPLDEYFSWQRNLFKAPQSQLSAQDKIIATLDYEVYNRAAKRKGSSLARTGKQRDGVKLEPLQVWREDVAKRAGCSVDTVSESHKHLEEVGAIRKHDILDRETMKKQGVAIALLPALLEDPQALQRPEGERRNHGGKRVKKCDACGSENIVEHKKWICADCGAIHTTFDPQPVNPPSEETPPAPTAEPGPRPHDGILDLATRRGKGTPRPEREPAPEPAPAPLKDPWGLRDVLVALADHTGNEPPVLAPVPGWTVEVTRRGEAPVPEQKTRESLARKLRDGYHEMRPTPEECEHLPNLVTRLANGDLFCADCGGRNDQLTKRGA